MPKAPSKPPSPRTTKQPYSKEGNQSPSIPNHLPQLPPQSEEQNPTSQESLRHLKQFSQLLWKMGNKDHPLLVPPQKDLSPVPTPSYDSTVSSTSPCPKWTPLLAAISNSILWSSSSGRDGLLLYLTNISSAKTRLPSNPLLTKFLTTVSQGFTTNFSVPPSTLFDKHETTQLLTLTHNLDCDLDLLLRTRKSNATMQLLTDPVSFVNWIQQTPQHQINQALALLADAELILTRRPYSGQLQHKHGLKMTGEPGALNVTRWVIAWTNAGTTDATSATTMPPDIIRNTVPETHNEHNHIPNTPTSSSPALRSLGNNPTQPPTTVERYNNLKWHHRLPSQLPPTLQQQLHQYPPPPPSPRGAVPPPRMEQPYSEPVLPLPTTWEDQESLILSLARLLVPDTLHTPPHNISTTKSSPELRNQPEESRNLITDDPLTLSPLPMW